MVKNSSLVYTYPEYWKNVSPGKIALIHNESGRQLMYHQFAKQVDIVALRLLYMGVAPGDRVAILLPPSIEGVVIFFACAKIGAICVPFNLQLPKREFIRRIQFIQPKAFFFVGTTHKGDYSIVGKTVRMMCPLIPHFIQVNLCKQFSTPVIPGVNSWDSFFRNPASLRINSPFGGANRLPKIQKSIHAWSPVLMFFNGTNNNPILLCHENILIQAELVHREAQINNNTKMLANQFLSEMGIFIHGICATLIKGGTVILSENFDPLRIHKTIEDYCITHLNQYIHEYEVIWEEASPASCMHRSLKFAMYHAPEASQLFQEPFLSKMKHFVPTFGTGIFIPEAGGFIGFNAMDAHQHSISESIQTDPALIQVSIREDMKPDHSSGEEVPDGFPGILYIHPPSVFLGYYNTPQPTSKVLTKEGLLCTSLRGIRAGSSLQIADISEKTSSSPQSSYSSILY